VAVARYASDGGEHRNKHFLTLCAACFFGLSVPAALHALKLDPKIAAGPVTLAFTDIFTLFSISVSLQCCCECRFEKSVASRTGRL
jgi:hypothetical protein